MQSLYEQNGGTYRIVNDYRVPNFTLQDESEHHIGLWGKRRLAYLKNHRRVLYVNLLTSGKLTEHLREIDTAAYEQHEAIVRQMAAAQGVTEQLKADDAMLWVGKLNNVRACADEIVSKELICN